MAISSLPHEIASTIATGCGFVLGMRRHVTICLSFPIATFSLAAASKTLDLWPSELHVYPTGGYGYGLRRTEHVVTTWPDRAADWMRSRQLPGESK